MSLNREEVAADLIWRYIEHLRAARAEGASVELTPRDLDQLMEAFQVAGRMPDALETPESDARRAAVRRRLEEAVQAPSAPAPVPPTSGAQPWKAALADAVVPIWRYRAAVSLALTLAVCLSTVGFWHHPSPVVKRVRVPVNASGLNIQPIEEAQVHELLPRMLHNELPPQQERNLMWHMLVCRGCFNQYVELRHSQHTAAELREELVQFVRR